MTNLDFHNYLIKKQHLFHIYQIFNINYFKFILINYLKKVLQNSYLKQFLIFIHYYFNSSFIYNYYNFIYYYQYFAYLLIFFLDFLKISDVYQHIFFQKIIYYLIFYYLIKLNNYYQFNFANLYLHFKNFNYSNIINPINYFIEYCINLQEEKLLYFIKVINVVIIDLGLLFMVKKYFLLNFNSNQSSLIKFNYSFNSFFDIFII